jgi:hypothetical protein
MAANPVWPPFEDGSASRTHHELLLLRHRPSPSDNTLPASQIVAAPLPSQQKSGNKGVIGRPDTAVRPLQTWVECDFIGPNPLW